MMSVITMMRINATFLAAGLALLSSASQAQLPSMEWSEEIRPGISESELKNKLNNMGVQFSTGPSGLTYSSMVSISERDYLFCQDRLYAMVEGVFVTGEEFNEWFQAFLIAHQHYGQPNKYNAEEDWGRFRAEWNLNDGSTFYFQLQSNLKDKQGWSRQLYAKKIGAPCLDRRL